MTRRTLSEHWSIDLDDSFTGQVVDGDLQLVSPGPPPRTVLLALWYPPPERSPEELMAWVLAEVNPDPVERFQESDDPDELRYASWYPETVDGQTQYALYGYVVRRGSYVQAAFFADDAAQRDWALATWRSLQYSPPQHAPADHS
ncbi:MAG: hypothetical protein QOJ32_3139 [Frankiaceae bacterium]|jgi:hypothetical protein|nr:hypothetical protein [Frankiaceae bacterium]